MPGNWGGGWAPWPRLSTPVLLTYKTGTELLYIFMFHSGLKALNSHNVLINLRENGICESKLTSKFSCSFVTTLVASNDERNVVGLVSVLLTVCTV